MTREEKARIIAEKMCWDSALLIEELAEECQTFDRLLDIVETINTTLTNDDKVRSIEISDLCVRVTIGDLIKTFVYTSHLKLIDALQDAILFYFDNKDKRGGEC